MGTVLSVAGKDVNALLGKLLALDLVSAGLKRCHARLG